MTLSARILFALVAYALLVVASTPDVRAEVVAVFYFDNNTGDKEYDVLQKGFADMMITDLAEVPGITVVEREKLEVLLDEVKLQKSPYFDKKTAIKMGRGLGARYAVTGAFYAAKPKLRIDVRMIDISTGKVTLTSKVTGPQEQIFELEQQLVAKFIAGLGKSTGKAVAAPTGRPRTKVPDVDVLVDYSKGIDLADRGNYEEAEKTMARVIRRAPTFALARIKRDQFIKRLSAAKTRRRDIRAGRSMSLAKQAEDFLADNDLARLSKKEAQRYLAYRVLRGRFIASTLSKHLGDSGYRMIRPGHERKARKLMKAYYSNARLLIKELDQYAADHSRRLPNGT
ncbi:MAG: CsgG/HfaB family protein, partial [Myxococcota bacterium]